MSTKKENEKHPLSLETDPKKLPSPSRQPGTLPDGEIQGGFSSTEIAWWHNGVWGKAGYAIPNPNGQHLTKNSTVHGLHAFIGQELFKLMHEPDVRFSRPPNHEWLNTVATMIRLGRKRLDDRVVDFNDERKGDARHNQNALKEFYVWPVPFWGGRIENPDALEWCEIILNLLGEIQQHSDNGFDADITTFLASDVDRQLSRIQYSIATKFLGVTREIAEASDYVLPARIDETNYNPDNLFSPSEMIDERPPANWWPTATDLSEIQAIPSSVAHQYALRYPISEASYGHGGAHQRSNPGAKSSSNRLKKPGTRR